MTTYNKILLVKKELSENLAFRDLAITFFDTINSLNTEKVVLDFSGIKSISRSFAHEYSKQKEFSKLEIIEENVPDNVKKMLKVVSEPETKPRIIDFSKLKVVCI